MQSSNAQLRLAARETARAARDFSERRVYGLNSATVARVLRFQVAQTLPSEAAAVRRLLDIALTDWERRMSSTAVSKGVKKIDMGAGGSAP